MQLTFRASSTQEIQEHSFGRVSKMVFPCPETWQARKDTLFDPRIFGPEESWICACGKFDGIEQRGIICDRCGVKIGDAPERRRSRFGHIQLTTPISHPLDKFSMIDVIPVIPIAFRTDTEELDLDFLYSRVLHANALRHENSRSELEQAYQCLLFNEWSVEPTRLEGRMLHSLIYYGFDRNDSRIENIGLFLFSMGLKVELTALEPPSSSA